MKEISLTRGKVAIVDDCDFYRLNRWKWHAIKGTSGIWYAARNDRTTGKHLQVRMHREIAAVMGFPHVDHWDGNGLHNWRNNLRPCTCSQNQANRGPTCKNRSGFKGVAYNKRLGKWVAYVQCQKVCQYLGVFNTPIEAAQVRDKKAKELFGPFAYLNFPITPRVSESS